MMALLMSYLLVLYCWNLSLYEWKSGCPFLVSALYCHRSQLGIIHGCSNPFLLGEFLPTVVKGSGACLIPLLTPRTTTSYFPKDAPLNLYCSDYKYFLAIKALQYP